jgi:signal peptidase II
MSRKGAVVAIFVTVGLLDWWSKWWVSHTMRLNQSLVVIPHVLWITYITNSGAAFSLMRHQQLVFIVVAIAILGAIVYYLVTARELTRLMTWGLGLLAGGTAGNLWDRIISGKVVDFIHVRYWAIFNVADMAIVIGIGLLVLEFWNRDRQGGADHPHARH